MSDRMMEDIREIRVLGVEGGPRISVLVEYEEEELPKKEEAPEQEE